MAVQTWLLAGLALFMMVILLVGRPEPRADVRRRPGHAVRLRHRAPTGCGTTRTSAMPPRPGAAPTAGGRAGSPRPRPATATTSRPDAAARRPDRGRPASPRVRRACSPATSCSVVGQTPNARGQTATTSAPAGESGLPSIDEIADPACAPRRGRRRSCRAVASAAHHQPPRRPRRLPNEHACLHRPYRRVGPAASAPRGHGDRHRPDESPRRRLPRR